MAEKGATVLVACDVQAHRDSLCRALRLYGHGCVCATSVEDAVCRLAPERDPPIDVVVASVAGPAGLGSRVVRALHGAGTAVPVVAIAGGRAASQAAAPGARGVRTITMPFDPEALRRAVAEALDGSGERQASMGDDDP